MEGRIIFATNNKHKLEELSAILEGKFKVLGLKDIGFEGEIPETGSTLAENAYQKSHFIYERFGLDCFSDDTGLEVDALGGRPGVRSARFAGDNSSYAENVDKLLRELKGKKDRSARFRTVISLILKGKEYQFEGSVEGSITEERHGEKGFGYDPVFLPDGYNQTFAEMPASRKNKISHRARAVAKLVAFLKK